ncbi:classical arabinogalactan protein 9-like [Myzus persicae]|uniref:classical arabinogalactan protein 9-like n=1 Tax=Myzus persicae TaxID=13164 RepID=UPI000B935F6B|nr:classical arabinogalactan protein 9-like [Myzus persicae]
MNALIIAVAVLAASVTLLVVEATPVNSYRNPSPSCGTVEPSCGTVDQDSNGGCTCSGSWQPRCSCPNPQNCPHLRRYNLRPCSCKPQLPTTYHLPSCSAPPVATTPIPYQMVQYSPCPTSSSPDLPSTDSRPCLSPSLAPVAVPAGPPSCAAQQLPCPFCASQQQPSCSCGGSPLSVNCPSDFKDEDVPSPTPCLAPPQLPLLPKYIPIALRPLSYNIHRPSAP